MRIGSSQSIDAMVLIQSYHIQNEAIAYQFEDQSLGHRLATEIDDAPSHPRKLASKERGGKYG